MHVRSLMVPVLFVLAVGCSSAASPGAASPGAATPTPPSEAVTPSGAPSESAAPAGRTGLDLTTDGALGIVDGYFAAYDAGDIDGMIALLTPDARVGFAREDWGAERWRNLHEWHDAQRTEMLPRKCKAAQVDDPGTVTVDCEYAQHPYLSRVVDGPAVPFTGRFVVTSDGIADISQRFGTPDFNAIDRPFQAWLQAHHPDVLGEVRCCRWESVEDARKKGALVANYADRWAVWLDDHPTCTWRDIDCQSDGA